MRKETPQEFPGSIQLHQGLGLAILTTILPFQRYRISVYLKTISAIGEKEVTRVEVEKEEFITFLIVKPKSSIALRSIVFSPTHVADVSIKME